MPAMTTLHFSETYRDGVLILEVRGPIDSALALDPMIDVATQTTAHHVVVVISDVDYINSAGFSALIRLSEAVTQLNKGIYIVGLQSKVHLVFTSLGAHAVLNILPSLKDALERIGTSPARTSS
jgi:anti-anti-sigma factor